MEMRGGASTGLGEKLLQSPEDAEALQFQHYVNDSAKSATTSAKATQLQVLNVESFNISENVVISPAPIPAPDMAELNVLDCLALLLLPFLIDLTAPGPLSPLPAVSIITTAWAM
jgi:hypothetical protein